MNARRIAPMIVLALSAWLSCGTPPDEGGASSPAAPAAAQKNFPSANDAAQALIAAAERWDVPALTEILGVDGINLVVTQDTVQDRNQGVAFAAQAREKSAVVPVPDNPDQAILTVGPEDWPLPIPIVRGPAGWRFDAKAGGEELLYRRIGRNELDAIEVCRGYIEAQHEYASEKRDGAPINQYAQRVVSTPGRQDGLAWQDPDGAWQGPVGPGIARAIAEGYSDKLEPYHGYYFKILKGQGPHARFGEMDFMLGKAMIGGFAMVAAPAEYEVTGVKTFLVSHEGVVYEKDLGADTVEQIKAMTRYDPDPTWQAVPEP